MIFFWATYLIVLMTCVAFNMGIFSILIAGAAAFLAGYVASFFNKPEVEETEDDEDIVIIDDDL